MIQNNNAAEIKEYPRLSVQVSLTGLSFLIENEEGNFSFFKETCFDLAVTPNELLIEIRSLYNTYEELSESFADIRVIYDNMLFSLVPKELFDEANLPDYLKFNSKILKSDYITFDKIEEYDLFNVYVPYTNVTNYFFDKYGEFTFSHSISVFTKALLDIEQKNDKTQLFIHVNNTDFTLLAIANGKIKLCNKFPFSSKEDFIYYILFAAEQLEINPDTFNLYFLGAITEDDEYFQITYKYIRNVFLHKKNKSASSGQNITSNFILKNAFI